MNLDVCYEERKQMDRDRIEDLRARADEERSLISGIGSGHFWGPDFIKVKHRAKRPLDLFIFFSHPDFLPERKR